MIGAFLISPFGDCSQEATSKIKVVTGSTLLTYAVQQVAGDKVEIINLIPPSQHPGNFSAKPGDIEHLAQSRFFFLHGWPGEAYAETVVAAADNPGLIVIKVGVDGNWMIPQVQLDATNKIVDNLCQFDGDNASHYQQSGQAYRQRVQTVEAETREKSIQANVSRVYIISSFRQADFLEWAAFHVTATFTSPESLTPQKIQELVDQGKSDNVTLVVNNLQDCFDAGKGIAEEIGARSINLSNFPGGFANTETWEKAVNYNVDLLLDILSDNFTGGK